MRLISAILVGSTTYSPGHESQLLTGPHRAQVDWAQLERDGIVEFADESDRNRYLDPQAAEQQRQPEAKGKGKTKARADKAGDDEGPASP